MHQHLFDRACPLCGTPSAHAVPTHYGSAEWPIITCRQCGLVFVARTPVQAEFEDERAWKKALRAKLSGAHATMARYLRSTV
jgi:rubredoxin